MDAETRRGTPTQPLPAQQGGVRGTLRQVGGAIIDRTNAAIQRVRGGQEAARPTTNDTDTGGWIDMPNTRQQRLATTQEAREEQRQLSQEQRAEYVREIDQIRRQIQEVDHRITELENSNSPEVPINQGLNLNETQAKALINYNTAFERGDIQINTPDEIDAVIRDFADTNANAFGGRAMAAGAIRQLINLRDSVRETQGIIDLEGSKKELIKKYIQTEEYLQTREKLSSLIEAAQIGQHSVTFSIRNETLRLAITPAQIQVLIEFERDYLSRQRGNNAVSPQEIDNHIILRRAVLEALTNGRNPYSEIAFQNNLQNNLANRIPSEVSGYFNEQEQNTIADSVGALQDTLFADNQNSQNRVANIAIAGLELVIFDNYELQRVNANDDYQAFIQYMEQVAQGVQPELPRNRQQTLDEFRQQRNHLQNRLEQYEVALAAGTVLSDVQTETQTDQQNNTLTPEQQAQQTTERITELTNRIRNLRERIASGNATPAERDEYLLARDELNDLRYEQTQRRLDQLERNEEERQENEQQQEAERKERNTKRWFLIGGVAAGAGLALAFPLAVPWLIGGGLLAMGGAKLGSRLLGNDTEFLGRINDPAMEEEIRSRIENQKKWKKRLDRIAWGAAGVAAGAFGMWVIQTIAGAATPAQAAQAGTSEIAKGATANVTKGAASSATSQSAAVSSAANATGSSGPVFELDKGQYIWNAFQDKVAGINPGSSEYAELVKAAGMQPGGEVSSRALANELSRQAVANNWLQYVGGGAVNPGGMTLSGIDLAPTANAPAALNALLSTPVVP